MTTIFWALSTVRTLSRKMVRSLSAKFSLCAVGGNGIAVFSLPGWLLDQVQLLDIAGNGGLGADLIPLAWSRSSSCSWVSMISSLMIWRSFLAVVFHFLEASSFPFFCPVFRKSSFWRAAPACVVYFEVLTRTWSPFFKENALPPSTER